MSAFITMYVHPCLTDHSVLTGIPRISTCSNLTTLFRMVFGPLMASCATASKRSSAPTSQLGEWLGLEISPAYSTIDVLTREQMQFCNVIIYSYHYLLDPKIAERVSKDLSKDCIVVFDEAHNIDNVCIESLSTDITEDSLRKATRGAQNLERKINQMRETDQRALENEYQKLVQGLRQADDARQEDALMANPGKLNGGFSFQSSTDNGAVLPEDLLKEAVPGNIRRAEHFVSFLKRFIEYLKVRYLSTIASPGCSIPPLSIINAGR